MPTSTTTHAAAPARLGGARDGSGTHVDLVHDHLLRIGVPASTAASVVADAAVRSAARASDGVPGAATLPAVLRAAHAALPARLDRAIDDRGLDGPAAPRDLAAQLVGTLAALELEDAAAYHLTVRHGLRPATVADVLSVPSAAVTAAADRARTALQRTAASAGAGAGADVDTVVRGLPVVAAPSTVRHLTAGTPVARRAQRRPLRPTTAWAAAALALVTGLGAVTTFAVAPGLPGAAVRVMAAELGDGLLVEQPAAAGSDEKITLPARPALELESAPPAEDAADTDDATDQPGTPTQDAADAAPTDETPTDEAEPQDPADGDETAPEDPEQDPEPTTPLVELLPNRP